MSFLTLVLWAISLIALLSHLKAFREALRSTLYYIPRFRKARVVVFFPKEDKE